MTLYPLAESDDSLLTINLHAVNFSFGVKAYRAQLAAAAKVIRAHQGPVIFGGDLNSWNNRRQAVLDALTDDLGLSPVTFSPDHRTMRFGRPLDHLYVRGLTRQSSETVQVETSDHNPPDRHLAAPRPMIRLLLSLILVVGSMATVHAETDAEKEIRSLIQWVAESDCEFNRNGSLHSAEAGGRTS